MKTRRSLDPRKWWRPGEPHTRWVNWAGNQSCEPQRIEKPLTEAQLQAIVRDAAAAGLRVRAVGAGHSFTAAACTDDVLVSLEHLNLVRSIDHAALTVTVGAGIELQRLNTILARADLAMTNLGDIAYQSLAGAVSTGTHGTGLRFGGLATQLRKLRLVTATGDIVECSADEHPELFHVARVGLGAFGIITRATIDVVPAFNLHAIERPQPIETVLDGWAGAVREHDHYEFFWIPGTDTAMTKTHRRTNEPAEPLPRRHYLRDKILAQNVGFGALTKIASVRPSLVPKLTDIITSNVETAEYIDASHRVFASPRWVKFVEMEYGVPLADLPNVVREIDQAVRSAGLQLLFPIEARTSAADDIPLSTAHGRESAYVAVHRAKGQPYRAYFELVEAIVDSYQGRPHWGKLHFQTATTLAERYPEWAEFQRVRSEMDPAGRFTNDYTDRVFGR